MDESQVQGLLGLAGSVGQIGAGYAYSDLMSDRGQQYANQMGELGAQLQADSQFKTYGITPSSAIGGATQDAAMGAAGNAGIAAGQATMSDAVSMLGANSSNPAYGQAMGMYGQNASNSQMGNALAGQQAGMQGLSAQQANTLNASNAMMQQSMQGTAGREQDIYSRAMAMQQPALDAQRAQMNAREFAQGRSGIRGSQFGGTGEDAAMARAQAQAQNTAAFQSMGQAQAEQMQQANIANLYGGMGQGAAGLQGNLGMNMGNLGLSQAQLGQAAAQGMGNLGLSQAQLGQAAANSMGQIGANQGQLGLGQFDASFAGMDRATQAAQVANQQMQMAQTGQLTGAGYAAQLGLGGIQTAVNADKAGSELMGNILAAQINAAGNSQGESGGGGLFSQLGQALGI